MRWMFGLILLFAATTGSSHEGEDHGAPAAAPSTPLAPRVEAHTADFELLGIVADRKLIIYLDRYATNEPVTSAVVEIESGSNKVRAEEQSAGVFVTSADWLLSPGKHDLVFAVQAGEISDILPGLLEIPDAARTGHQPTGWSRLSMWSAGAGALAVGIVLIMLARRKRTLRAAAALVPIVLLVAQGVPEPAYGDENHGKDPKGSSAAAPPGSSIAATAPVRLPDGSVFVPKPVQRQLGIRTLPAAFGELAASVELKGHVIPDPNASGRLQATQSGRIEAGPKGLPHLGQRVTKGQILAYLVPVANAIERGNQQAQLADLTSQLELAERKVQRLDQLEGSIPRKDIETARTDVESLRARRMAVNASLYQRETLTAPVSGVVSTISVAVGQVVEARDVLFEIIDPQRLWVEAVAYDMALAGRIAAATAAGAGGQPLKLSFIGVGYQLREQALPLHFRLEPPLPPMSVGERIKLFVQTRQTVNGVPLPQVSLTKTTSGDAAVWVHVAAERFALLKVKTQVLSADEVAVTAGLKAGERVVTQGATLLTQIR